MVGSLFGEGETLVGTDGSSGGVEKGRGPENDVMYECLDGGMSRPSRDSLTPTNGRQWGRGRGPDTDRASSTNGLQTPCLPSGFYSSVVS